MDALYKWGTERQEALRKASQKPDSPVSQGMKNVRQILMGVIMYANEHRGVLPDNIEQVIEPYVKDKAILRNPRQPDRENGYVWVKPSEKISQVRNASQTIVLYEAYDKWPEDGLVAGFLDGHVELLKEEQAFKQKLEAQKPPK